MSMPSIKSEGWCLDSAERRHQQSPSTFEIPTRKEREALQPGDAAKLLFDIETREGGEVLHRGVDRMWVVVKSRTSTGYLGLLDNDPGLADGFDLRPGDQILFGPEHVAGIDTPPRQYVEQRFGPDFFER